MPTATTTPEAAPAPLPGTDSVATDDTARLDRRDWSTAAELLRVLAVAAIPTGVFFLLALRHLTYAWDDFIQFGITQRYGLSRELLTYGLFEHLGPANRLAHGLLVTFGGVDTRWAIALATPIFFVYCAAFTDLARVLGAGWGRVTLGLAVTTVTPATVSVSAVLDQYLHVMLTAAATAVAAAAYVRWVRRQRVIHAVVGALAVGLACAVQERGVFILLFLLIARVLVIDGGVLPGRWMGAWLRTWWRDVPFLAAPTSLAVATMMVVALKYVVDAPRGGLSETAVLVGRTWGEQLGPMITGTYGLAQGSGRPAVLVLGGTALLALLIWSVRRDVRNVRPWLLLLAWSGFLTTFLGLGRLGITTADAVLADPQYATYSLVAVMVLIACLARHTHGAPLQATGWTPRRPLLLQLASAAVLAGLVVHSALPASARSDQFAPGYLDASVRDLLRANDEAAAVVAPTRVPDALVPPTFFPFNSGELYLREVDSRTIVDVDPQSPLFLDDTGQLTEGSAERLLRVEPGAPGSGTSVQKATRSDSEGVLCVSARAGRVSIPLPARVDLPGGAAWVRVIADGDDTEGSPAVGDSGGWSIGAVAPLTAEHGSVSFMVPADGASQVDLLDVRADALCIEAIEVWALSAPGPDGCAWVGPDGRVVPARASGAAPTCRG